MIYRVGRSQPQNIYIQIGDDPAKTDPGIGRMDNVHQAAEIVKLANAGLKHLNDNNGDK